MRPSPIYFVIYLYLVALFGIFVWDFLPSTRRARAARTGKSRSAAIKSARVPPR